MATQGTHRSRTTAEKRDADERERKAQGDIALSIESVSKSFGTELAVDELSLSVRQGDEIGRASCRERVYVLV